MALIDMSATVLKYATAIAVKRRASSTTVKGKAVPGALSNLTVMAVCAPVQGRELERLPEGMRTEEVIQVITVDELRTSDATGTADLVTWQGRDYEVQLVADYSQLGNFRRYYAAKVERT